MSNSINKNYYLNKNNNIWSNDKYVKIFSKISKGKFIKLFDYYSYTNLETEVSDYYGIVNIYPDAKKVLKIFINVTFLAHIENDNVLTVYYSDIDYNNYDFDFKEKDGKRHYDGTSIFTIDASELELCRYVQVITWFMNNYMIINNVTLQYENDYLKLDHLSYKKDILNGIIY